MIAVRQRSRHTSRILLSEPISAGSVEVGQIQVHQILAAIKHPNHIRYLGGIETGQIQLGQAAAIYEHTAHVRHIGSIKTISKVNFL